MITQLSPNDLSMFRPHVAHWQEVSSTGSWLNSTSYLSIYLISRRYTSTCYSSYHFEIKKLFRLFYSSCTYLRPQLWYFWLFKTCIVIILICSIRTSLIIWYLNINDRFHYMYKNDICCNNFFLWAIDRVYSVEKPMKVQDTIYTIDLVKVVYHLSINIPWCSTSIFRLHETW